MTEQRDKLLSKWNSLFDITNILLNKLFYKVVIIKLFVLKYKPMSVLLMQS